MRQIRTLAAPAAVNTYVDSSDHARRKTYRQTSVRTAGPDDDEVAVTAAQVRDAVTRLIEAGHWCKGDPRVPIIFDAG
jgi:hypothetical protein